LRRVTIWKYTQGRELILNRGLGLPPNKKELSEFISILDPDSEGFAVYPSFLAICALKLHNADHSSESHAKEVDEAYGLFIAGGGEGKITLATLKRVAKMLKEDVDEAVLRDMILEANGSTVGKGVERDEFEGIMRRAGAWR
jgi:Ca2+-binding EF-hand superfamily protein